MSDLAACLTAATSHFRANRLDDAEQHCLQALVLEPGAAQALHILGLIALQRGNPEPALAFLVQAAEADPGDATIANSQGSIFYQLHRYAEAEPAFRRAVAAGGTLRDPLVNLGNTLLQLNRPTEAASSFRRALALNPRDPEGHNNLGTALRNQGRLDEAGDCFRTALVLASDYLEARYNLGLLLAGQMKYQEALDCFEKVIAAAPGVIVAQVAVGHMLNALGRSEESLTVFEAVLAEAPDHPEANYAARLAYGTGTPRGQIAMINDQVWIDGWRRAIERVVAPGVLALDLGTGSGLLAMIAARGGAQVVSCESNPTLALVAGQTVAANGLADQIKLLAKPSLQLRTGQDLPHQADVLIADLAGPGLLVPNLLPALRHALAQLVKPGAKILPARATVYGGLLSCEMLARMAPVRTVCGFDLSRFDRFRQAGASEIDLVNDPHQPLSDPFVALEFDFTRPVADHGQREIELIANASGLCHGIAQWFDLHLDDEITITSAPRDHANHWRQVAHFFSTPITVEAGQRLTVVARWDNTQIHLELKA
ncbi:conserved hypothetical protein [uncultured Gammaproteobacteria bacterium]